MSIRPQSIAEAGLRYGVEGVPGHRVKATVKMVKSGGVRRDFSVFSAEAKNQPLLLTLSRGLHAKFRAVHFWRIGSYG